MTSSVRKKCPRCGATSTTDMFGQQYWGVISKLDSQLICKECGISEIYDRMFGKPEVVDDGD